MITLLTTLNLLLFLIIVYLNIQYYKEKKNFGLRVDALKQLIVKISNKKNVQSNKIKLSEELDIHLETYHSTLRADIYNLNYELFETISKHQIT